MSAQITYEPDFDAEFPYSVEYATDQFIRPGVRLYAIYKFASRRDAERFLSEKRFGRYFEKSRIAQEAQ